MSIYTKDLYPSSTVKPYVYKGIHRITGKVYIGSRYTKHLKLPPDQDLGRKYKTTSKNVKPHFEEYDWTIILECFDAKAAWEYEQLLIYEQWQIDKSQQENIKCYHGKTAFNNIGNPVSKETIEKAILTRKTNKANGKKESAESSLRRSLGQKQRIYTEDFSKIMSEATKGKPKSEQHRNAIQEASKRQENNKFRGKQTRVKCPHCDVIGGELTMPRWHFDNCKNKVS